MKTAANYETQIRVLEETAEQLSANVVALGDQVIKHENVLAQILDITYRNMSEHIHQEILRVIERAEL